MKDQWKEQNFTTHRLHLLCLSVSLFLHICYVCLFVSIRAPDFSETWGQLVDTQMLKFQNAKGPYTSVSIFSSNEIVSPSVLHKMRYFQRYLLTLITHTPLPKKYLMSLRHSVCPKISHHLDKSPAHIWVEHRFCLALLTKLHTKIYPCQNIEGPYPEVVHHLA